MATAANFAAKGSKAIGDGHKAVERAGGAPVVAGAAVVGAGVGKLLRYLPSSCAQESTVQRTEGLIYSSLSPLVSSRLRFDRIRNAG